MAKQTPSQPIDQALYQERQTQAQDWFRSLRDDICAAFEAIEQDYVAKHPHAGPAGKFEQTAWQRNDEQRDGGGGVMARDASHLLVCRMPQKKKNGTEREGVSL